MMECVKDAAELNNSLEKLTLDRLDWAIAGTSSSTPTSDPNVTKGQWRHWVSSRTKNAEDMCDEGYNHPQPDGKTLEKGTMVNPETGLDTEYEELWRDEKPLPTTSPKVKTIVWRLEKGDDTKGLVVLLGVYCQGLLRRGHNITAERWQWAQSGGWVRTISIGDDTIPCPEIMEERFPSCGESVAVGNDSWQVIESLES